ncbi:MAG: NB-ARC domain-containing protein, partial [Nocardioides sp.]
ARDLARAALEFVVPGVADGDGPLQDVRRAAGADLDTAGALLGRAASGVGDHEEALTRLEVLRTRDEATTAALLRSEAAVRGAPAALARYERHRERVREALGVDPGPELQAVHAELLASDNPVRAGLRFEATSLVGREDDLRALRALVRESRVISILGPGGLGKTRLAHLLGREAEQPVVHFVELVGVVAAEDVVGELGSALGVRDSVSGRRVLSHEQRNDVRAQIAQHLDQAPTLLILDNCEHVVGAVAELVAFLVATSRRLRVVTTTRAPLAIAAERVFPLSQLDEDDAADLFRQRADAARPGVPLDDAAVRRVVARLDGLPLAIELAAAKVRAMSVEDIDRRLDNRFALLRGGDRGAPDRHQTLLAVIDWSWNLLAAPERRALRWLSVFHDGFPLDAADDVLGHDPLDVVQSLVDQSLLTVVVSGSTVRYRMLETVREFGRMQLVDAGEDAEARAAQVAWARTLAEAARCGLYSMRQVEVMDALRVEENNLADVLHEALARPDQGTTVVLLAALGGYWTIKGEHPRIISMCAAVEDALRGWQPPTELVESAVVAASVVAMNTMMADLVRPEVCLGILDDHGHRATQPQTASMVRVLRTFDPLAPGDSVTELEALYDDPDRLVAALALQFSSHGRENAGDPEGAIEVASRALTMWRAEDGPWHRALLHTQLAGLFAQLGRHVEAGEHALAAIPVLDRLDAHDDAIGARSVLACTAIAEGRLDEAGAWIAEIRAMTQLGRGFSGPAMVALVEAELELARDHVDAGLELYRRAVNALREVWFPGLGDVTGLEPWTLFGEGSAAMAFAVHGADGAGADLEALLRSKAAAVLDPERQHFDLPVVGVVVYALAGWGLLRGTMPAEPAVRLAV